MPSVKTPGDALADIHDEAVAALDAIRDRLDSHPRIALLGFKLDWVRRVSGRDLAGIYRNPSEAIQAIRAEMPALRSYAVVAGFHPFPGSPIHARIDAMEERSIKVGFLRLVVPEPEPEDVPSMPGMVP